MNTPDLFSISNAICPDREFMIFEGQRFTYAQTNERINRLVNAFNDLGLKKGDRVAILQVNCSQSIEIYFATAKSGIIFVPLNFRAESDALRYMLENSGPKILFIGDRYREMVDNLLPELPTIERCIVLDDDNGSSEEYEDLVQSSNMDELETNVSEDDITILMYTAGTTGRPKGVPLTHSNFTSYVLTNVEPANPEFAEKNLVTVPLYHIAGIQAVMAAVYGGRTLVLMKQFEVTEWMTMVEQEKIDRAMLVPTMLKWIVDHERFEDYDLDSLKVITYGSAPMPFEVIKKAVTLFSKTRFINAFGQTETASTITVLGPEDHLIEGTEEEKEKKLRRLTASIGKPLADVELKIVDDQGTQLPPLEVGEILAKGPRIMSGYWKDEEKSSKVMSPDGWLKTGDKGWVDEDGYLYLSGRADDIIIRGGENIAPKEVEDVIGMMPDIEEVAVIGVPDPEWGQQPRAVVALKPGSVISGDEIRAYCASRLAGFKRPQSIVIVESLPRNQLGKLLKNKIREEFGSP